MEPDNMETFWSRHVDGYEKLQSNVCGEEIIDHVLRELRLETGFGKILELGCGTGLFTEALAENAEQIIATDLSDEMVAEAVRLRGNLDRVVFEKANATNLPYENDSFDTVFMANFIHLTEYPLRVIEESYRVLKKNGLILITSFTVDEMSAEARACIVKNFVETFGIPKRTKDRPKTTTVKDIEDLLRTCGFEIARCDLLGGNVKSCYVKGRKNLR